jgi:hypothetical protein
LFFMASVSTAFCLVWFFSTKDPAEHTFFHNLKIVDEGEARTPWYLRLNLLSRDLQDFFYIYLNYCIKNPVFKCVFHHIYLSLFIMTLNTLSNDLTGRETDTIEN